MTTQNDIQFEVIVPVSAERAYHAISKVNDWWVCDTTGHTSVTGDVFNVSFGSEGFVRFKVTEAQPARRYVWHVEDCFLPWFDDKTEWNGTDVVFDITPTADGSSIAMVHRGLTPDVPCYGICYAGWERYVTGSLKKLIVEGEGMPNARTVPEKALAQAQ